MKDTAKFQGIFTALLTPYGADGKINEKVLSEQIERNIKQGISGFYVNGSTAEVFLLSEDERNQLYRLVKEIAGNRVTLIAHIGCVGTEQALRFGKTAEELGYDAISSVAPFYYNFSYKEIKQHYFTLVDQIALPMIVYNFPKFSGVSFSMETFGEFLNDDRFLGIKHTSTDFFMLEQLKTQFPSKILFNGYDEMFLAGLAMGADGAIGSTFNLMADKFIRIMENFQTGNLPEAQRIQKQANQVIAALCKVGVMQGEKAVMKFLGLDFGEARMPFGKLEKEDIAYLEKTVLPLLNCD